MGEKGKNMKIKRAFYAVVTVAVVACTALFAIGPFKSITQVAVCGIKEANENDFADKNDANVMPKEATLVFGSIEEYEAFLTSGDDANNTNTHASTITYYTPTGLPDDLSLQSIEVNAGGTTYNYESSRNMSITLGDYDEATLAMLKKVSINVYDGKDGQTGEFLVTQPSLFAERLASAIDAVRFDSSNGDTASTYYLGDVPIRMRRTDGTYQSVVVGCQAVYIQDGIVCYSYAPVPYSLDEVENMMQLERRTIGGSSTNANI